MKQQVTIYTISDAKTGYVHYVGATTQILKNRLSGHRSYTNNRLHKIIKSVPVVIEAIDICSFQNAAALEQYWIYQFRAWGFDLTNYPKEMPYIEVRPTDKVVVRDKERISQHTTKGVFIKEWDNIYEASKAGFSPFQISKVLVGDKNTHAGFKWKFSKDKDFPKWETRLHVEYKDMLKNFKSF